MTDTTTKTDDVKKTLQDFPQKSTTELVSDLLQMANLTQLGDDVFLGNSQDYVGPRVYGGQVLAQALMAASSTLDKDKPCHSMHGYFLRGGDVRYPVEYQVRRLRDGRSLSAREVVAVQHRDDGKGGVVTEVIFSMIASFSPMEGGLDYQPTMPSYPLPDELLDEQTLKERYFDEVPAKWQARFMRRRHVTIKPVQPQNPIKPTPTAPKQAAWLCVEALGEQPVAIQQALLAFASDYYLAATGLLSHGINFVTRGLQIASIDHSMHFHRPFDINDWLLYDMWSDTTSHAKGLNHGQFWQDGKLVATTQQEGLMRLTTAV